MIAFSSEMWFLSFGRTEESLTAILRCPLLFVVLCFWLAIDNAVLLSKVVLTFSFVEKASYFLHQSFLSARKSAAFSEVIPFEIFFLSCVCPSSYKVKIIFCIQTNAYHHSHLFQKKLLCNNDKWTL